MPKPETRTYKLGEDKPEPDQVAHVGNVAIADFGKHGIELVVDVSGTHHVTGILPSGVVATGLDIPGRSETLRIVDPVGTKA